MRNFMGLANLQRNLLLLLFRYDIPIEVYVDFMSIYAHVENVFKYCQYTMSCDKIYMNFAHLMNVST